MNRNDEMRWWLLDGAVMGDTAAGNKLRGLPDAYAMYRDLGDDAARLGPWLLPFSSVAETTINAWRTTTEMACFGINRLDTGACREELIRHLHKLRHVCALRQPSRRFFLRYADHRGVAALWPSLRAAQQRAFLGPVCRWEWTGPDGVNSVLTAIWSDHGESDAPLPLRLHARAFQRLAHEARKGDLLVAAEEAYPDVGAQIPLGRRWQAARATWNWGQSRNIKMPAILMAALVVAVCQGVSLLDDDDFAQAARQAQEHANPSLLLGFGGGAAREADQA